MSAPDPFRVRLLGTFGLESAGRPFRHFNANRPELLLMYMAIAPDTWHLRKSIAADIWPSTDVSTARKHLSYNLFLLKKLTAAEGLDTPFEETRHSLRLRTDLGLDTREFLAELAAAGAAPTVDQRLRHLEAALELYGQGLLPSHRQSWLTPHQQRYHDLAEGARQMVAAALPTPVAAMAGQLHGVVGAWSAAGPSDAGPVHVGAAPHWPDAAESRAAPADGAASGQEWTLDALAKWAAEAEAAIQTPARDDWLMQFDALLPTITAALDHAVSCDRALDALPIPTALWDYYRHRQLLSDGRRQIDRLLAEVRAVPPLLHARALHASGTLAFFDNDRDVARRQLEKAHARWRAIREPGTGLLRTLGNLAITHQGLNELDRAAEIYGQCIAMARRLDEPRLLSTALYNAAQNEIRRRDPVRARHLIEQRQALLAEQPDVLELARNYALLAAVDILSGAHDDAWHEATLAVSLYTKAGDSDGLAHGLRLLGQIALAKGEYDSSLARYRESLKVAEESRSFWQVGLSLGGLAVLHRTRGEEPLAQATQQRATALLRVAQDEESVRRLAAEFAAAAPAPAARRKADAPKAG